MATVTGVGDGSANRTAFSENKISADSKNANITNASTQLYQAKTEFNQADLVRANLEGRKFSERAPTRLCGLFSEAKIYSPTEFTERKHGRLCEMRSIKLF